MPKLQWMLLAACLWGTANAKPVVQPDGVAGLYFKDDAGGLSLGCIISKVSSPKFQAVLERTDALLSAGHCVPEIPGYIPSFAYVTWDDGLSFVRVKPVLLGDALSAYRKR